MVLGERQQYRTEPMDHVLQHFVFRTALASDFDSFLRRLETLAALTHSQIQEESWMMERIHALYISTYIFMDISNLRNYPKAFLRRLCNALSICALWLCSLLVINSEMGEEDKLMALMDKCARSLVILTRLLYRHEIELDMDGRIYAYRKFDLQKPSSNLVLLDKLDVLDRYYNLIAVQDEAESDLARASAVLFAYAIGVPVPPSLNCYTVNKSQTSCDGDVRQRLDGIEFSSTISKLRSDIDICLACGIYNMVGEDAKPQHKACSACHFAM